MLMSIDVKDLKFNTDYDLYLRKDQPDKVCGILRKVVMGNIVYIVYNNFNRPKSKTKILNVRDFNKKFDKKYVKVSIRK